MVVKEFKIGSTTIEIDNTYFPKTYEENQKVYEEFNKIGCEILRNSNKWNGRDKQMKTIKIELIKILLTIMSLVFLLGIFGLAELLSKIITMDLVINICYISLVAGIIYIFKN